MRAKVLVLKFRILTFNLGFQVLTTNFKELAFSLEEVSSLDKPSTDERFWKCNPLQISPIGGQLNTIYPEFHSSKEPDLREPMVRLVLVLPALSLKTNKFLYHL